MPFSCIPRPSVPSFTDELARFQKDCSRAKKLTSTDHKESLKILAEWEHKTSFRASALLAELMLVSPDDRPAARRIIVQMSSEPYGMPQFNLAKFALFPPYAAVSQADFMEPLRVQALESAVSRDPFPWILRASPERKNRAFITPMSTLFTAAQAYLRMGMYRRASICGRKLKALANRVGDPSIKGEWIENANQCLENAKSHTAPSRILSPDN